MSSAILQQVVEATRGEYVVHGTLGQAEPLGSAFLAHDVATGRSVLLVVPPDAESLDVVGALSDAIPANAGSCAACSFRISTWLDACPRCEHALLPPSGASPDVGVLREQLRDAFDVVGSVPHVHGGTMYFGREVGDGRLTAFVIRPQADGQLALDLVWEEVPAEPARTAGTFAAPNAPTNGASAYDAAGLDGATGAPAFHEADASPPYAPAEHLQAAAPSGPAPRRRWLPIGLGVGVVAAIAGVAFALTRHDPPHPIRPAVDSTAPIPQPSVGASSGVAAGGASTTVSTASGGSLPPVLLNESLRRAQQQQRRRLRDSLRTTRAQDAAVLTIEGDLPSGWTRSLNGGAATSDRDVPLVVGVPSVIRIEAPGYCTDTLAMTPAPRSHKLWAPVLRGRPTVGEC